MRPRIYKDTSVVDGYFDDEFEEDTKLFFERIFNKDFLVYFSDISETELALAPVGFGLIEIRSPKDFVCHE